MKKHIITLDIGTTAVKVSIYNAALEVIACSNEEYSLISPTPQWVELAAETYWQAVKQGIANCVATSDIAISTIGAIVATTQGETLIAVDSEGIPLQHAIVWLDGRAEAASETITQHYDPQTFYQHTGIQACTGQCPISKLLWIKQNRPEIYTATYKFLLLEDYIIFRLTGFFVTEKSLMSTTGYYDIVEDRLWDDILQAVDIAADKIPDIVDCGTVISCLSLEAARDVGLLQNTIVIAGAMDQMAAAVGAGNIVPGIITETTGTALCVGTVIDKSDYLDMQTMEVYRHILPDTYMILPTSMTAGVVLKWFKDEFGYEEVSESEGLGQSVYDRINVMVEQTPPLANGLIVTPNFAGTLYPDYHPQARGIFLGVGLDTRKPHFMRAIYESIAYMLKEHIERIEQLSGQQITAIRSLGGGSKSDIWCQIKADVTGKTILQMEVAESTSLGAAIIAGTALGFWKDAVEAATLANRVKKRFEPRKQLQTIYEAGYKKYQAVYSSTKHLFHDPLCSNMEEEL